MDKIVKRLKREATANPKKAALLGLVTLVAVYFWLPLVWGWIKPSQNQVAVSTPADATVEAVKNTANAEEQAGGKDSENKKIPWQQLLEMMANDPRTKPAEKPNLARDPFEMPSVKLQQKSLADQQKDKEVKPVITPELAGLKLTGTIIGEGRAMAQVNGKAYKAGQTIQAGGEKSQVVEFRLVEIQPRRVVLEANGQLFELAIPDPSKTENIEFVGSGK